MVVSFVPSVAFNNSEDGASHHKKNQPLFEIESDPDLFHVLKVRKKKTIYGRNIMPKRKRMEERRRFNRVVDSSSAP